MIEVNSVPCPIERYPGEKIPPLPDWDAYPHPSIVGKYVSKEEFIKTPKWPAQWVHWEDRARLVLEGRYYEIYPVHFEGIFTLRCTFMCPHCDQRPARQKWVKDGAWGFNVPLTPNNTMDLEDLKYVIKQISSFKMDDYAGIVWGGGDPTTIPWVYEALRFAKYMGIHNLFLTNGVYMNVNELIEIAPDIVRVSLDCGSKEIHAHFHGYRSEFGYFDRVLNNIIKFARMKKENETNTLFGISLVVDERNLRDSLKAVKIIKDIAVDIGQKSDGEAKGIDYVIVRPVMNYPHFDCKYAQINKKTKREVYTNVKSEMKRLLDNVDIPVIPVKDSFLDPPPQEFYFSGCCLSYGWFSQILPRGDVQICSDSYSNPEYAMGNVLKESLPSLWRGEKRKMALKRINDKQCFMNSCPFNSRGHHLNRIFQQIERMREDGNIEIVEQWVKDLRRVTHPLRHSFFM